MVSSIQSEAGDSHGEGAAGRIETKRDYVQLVRAEQEKLDVQIDELVARARRSAAGTRAESWSKIEDLYVKRDEALAKLANIRQAGEGAWQELTTGFERARVSLRRAFERASARFE